MALSKTPVDAGEQTITDIQSITRLKQGDLSGLVTLVQRYQVKAVQAAVLIVRDRVLAEEIAQGCFFRAAEKIDQFDENRPFGPWFLRSVINAAIQEANRKKRLVSLESDLPNQVDNTAQWLIDPGLSPEDLVENEELYQKVWAALDQLTPNQRAAIVMRYFMEYSEAEMTEELHRPKTTIKWWLHEARKRLHHFLEPYFHSPEEKEADHE